MYLINYAGSGGSEKYVQTLAQNLIKCGGTPFLCYNKSGGLVDIMKTMGIICFKLEMAHPFDIKAAIYLAKLCKKYNIQVVHTQFARENYIAILAKIMHSKASVVYTSHINIKNNIIWKFTNYFFTKQNSAIIAVCNSVRNLAIQNNYPSNKITVIYNGVEVIHKNNEIIKSLLKESDFTFVTLARLSEEKGLFFLLESVKILVNNNESIKFCLKIAGDGHLKHNIQQYISDNCLHNYVKLLGHVSNTKDLLSTSHVYINSSYSEALSFGILEAMSYGLPIIVTNVGGNVDIIKNSNNGFLVSFGDAVNMSSAMLSIINYYNNPYSNMYNTYSNNSKIAIHNVFNINNVIEKTFNIYKSTN